MTHKYNDFAQYIDMDALYAEWDWEPMSSTGVEDRGQCFDLFGLHKHGDRTGKLSFNREKKVWNCWVCGGGNLVSLVMAMEDLNSYEATQWLAPFAHPRELDQDAFDKEIEALLGEGTIEETEKTLPHFNINVLNRWGHDHPWFAQRGIGPETCRRFKLRYDPTSMRISSKGESYSGPAIILPHFWEGKLVGWQNRWLDENRPPWIGKYTNTIEFPKDRTLWGLLEAQDHEAVVVESVATALFLYSENIPAVATFGAKINEAQMHHLRSFQKGIILAADTDDPGLRWRNILTEYLENFVPVSWAPLMVEEGQDIGDLAPDGEALRALLGASRPPT